MRRKISPLIVRPSPVHGEGVFSLRPITKGEVVGHYEGRRYPAGVVVECELDQELTYLFGLSDGTTIDGSEGGNATAQINHSCAPNCEALEHRRPDGSLVLRIVSRRPLPKDAELFIDYGLVVDAVDQGAYECRCGAKACRGTMCA